MEYEILTTDTLKNYIDQTDPLKKLVGTHPLQIQEVGDGNLNYVFIVKGERESFIVKQSLPFLRCVGESWKLSKNRMLFEIAALKKFHDLAKNHIPTLYHSDKKMCLVAMRYLDNHIILRKGLINKTYYPLLAEHLSTFLSKTLFKTSSYYLSSREKRIMEAEFNTNHDLCKLSEDLIFTFPYMDHETNHLFKPIESIKRELHQDSFFKMRVLELKYRFMTKKDALLHGDFHTGSIMVNEQDTFVIDPEFAFFGPFGFDIGALVANLLLSYISHGSSKYSKWLLETLREFLEKFQSKFLHLLNTHRENALMTLGFLEEKDLISHNKTIVQNIFQEALGFAGCKMTRRILGLAGVEDIRGIKDEKVRLLAEIRALNIAKLLVKEYDTIKDCDDLILKIKNAG